MNKIKYGAAIIISDDIRAASESILSSTLFLNAPCMNRLFRFIVEKTITGVVEDVNEYAIGVAVFNRDPATYNTSEDPIVRIQVGRLRKKLKQYYATFGAGVNIEISVPLGSYLPVAQPYRHCEERPPPPQVCNPPI